MLAVSPLIALADLQQSGLPPDAYVVFGGTFDPPHEGHISVARALLPYFRVILFAPTEQNPWKEAPKAIFAQRQEMVRMLLESELPTEHKSLRIQLLDLPYTFAEEAVAYCRAKFGPALYWAVGADSAESVAKWRNWEKLGVTTIVCPELVGVHGEKIRSSTIALHPALNSYVRSNHLYGY